MFQMHLSPTPESCVESAANFITNAMSQAIQERGKANLVVSGGQSPIPLYERINLIDIPWEKVTVTLADERWVDTTDGASNELTIHRHLLKQRAESACFVPLRNEAASPRRGARLTEQVLRVFPETLDVVVLGMGMDGHTLSWFPDAPELEALLSPATRDRCLGTQSPSAPHPRLSLTLRWIRQSRALVLFLSSVEKTRRFEDIMAQAESRLPVARLANDERVLLHVFGVSTRPGI